MSRSAPLRPLAVALAASFALAPAARAAPPMVVAVLYFDNNSSDRQYDVLQKGLADMLITDLASVESLEIVEREKLQKLIEELRLQRSRYFDPKTAQKLGQGVGARFAVTGAIAALDPELRLDVRLIEVATGKVVLADKVVGPKSKFFDLEQQLVQKFVGGLQVRSARAEARAGAVDVGTLLKYSQGLDQVDRGDFQAASKKLAEVVSDSPDFTLGKEKYAAIVRRLREAVKRREGALGSAEEVLWKNIEQQLAGGPPDGKDQRAVARYLGYRVARGNYLLWKIKARGGLVPGPTSDLYFVPRPRLGEVGGWMKQYVENTEKLAAEMVAVRPAGKPHWTADLAIDAEDTKRGEELGFGGIGDWSFLKVHRAYQAIGDYIARGKAPFWVSDHYRIRPTLALAEQGFGKRALEAFAKARADLDKLPGGDKEDDIAELTDLHAEALAVLDRREEAIARWQTFLDAYPRHKRFKEFEEKIEGMLGMGPEVEKFNVHLKACAPEGIGGLYEAANRAARGGGGKGLRRLLAEVEKSCEGKTFAMGWRIAAYQFLARHASEIGDCPLYDEVLGRARKLGPAAASPVEQIPSGCK